MGSFLHLTCRLSTNEGCTLAGLKHLFQIKVTFLTPHGFEGLLEKKYWCNYTRLNFGCTPTSLPYFPSLISALVLLQAGC